MVTRNSALADSIKAASVASSADFRSKNSRNLKRSKSISAPGPAGGPGQRSEQYECDTDSQFGRARLPNNRAGQQGLRSVRSTDVLGRKTRRAVGYGAL